VVCICKSVSDSYDDESIEDVANTEWAEENDVDWEEILDHRMS
jgi:hypothetical protein